VDAERIPNDKAAVRRPTSGGTPTWPRECDLATYSKYTSINFDAELSDAKTWIDIRCRTGKAMSGTREFCRARLIGVNAHPIDVMAGIEPVFAEIPRDRSVYEKFRKKMDLLTDVYGAFTHDNDPIAVLIYEACLLKQGGRTVIISLEAKLGNRANRQELKYFFEVVLGQNLVFKRFRTYSDNSRTPLNSLRITLTGGCRSRCGLETLLWKARQTLGEPNKRKLIYPMRRKTRSFRSGM
jgi:hypothetical protein